MKTIEEAAKEFEKINGENIFYGATENPDTKLSIESFKGGVEFAEMWIPVEEELPESDKILTTVIVKIEGKVVVEFLGYEIANFDKRDKQFHYQSKNNLEKVTHWRPINHK